MRKTHLAWTMFAAVLSLATGLAAGNAPPPLAVKYDFTKPVDAKSGFAPAWLGVDGGGWIAGADGATRTGAALDQILTWQGVTLSSNFTVSASVQVDTADGAHFAGVAFNVEGANNYYAFRINSGPGNGLWQVLKRVDREWKELKSTPWGAIEGGVPYTLIVQSKAPGIFTVSIKRGDEVVLKPEEVSDATGAGYAGGHAGIYMAAAECKILSFTLGEAPVVTGAAATSAPVRDFGLPHSTNPACIPVERTDWWPAYRKQMRAREPRQEAQVVFLGDSITMMWRSQQGFEGGTAVWEKYYAPFHAANFGIAADRTEHVLWRITQGGELDGMNPKVLVLLIGVNNLTGWSGRAGGDSPEHTAEGIATIVGYLKQHLPQTKILLLGIFPCMEKPDHPIRGTIRRTNAIIAKLADLKQVFFLDFGDRFVEPDGTITKEKLRDLLHLSEKGYRIWAEAMQPYFEDLMKNEGAGALWTRPLAPVAGATNQPPAVNTQSQAEFRPPRPAPDEAQFGAKIARTMTDLATSTPARRNPVRVLFYGQSITSQPWSQAIGNRLKQAYPNADFSFDNRAIGGFTAERLVKTAVHDLYPAYPDLVIFHVYGGDGGMNGGVGGELETIIASIRKLTTAEIVLTTHHVSHVGNAAAQIDHEKTSQLIRDLAAKYDCELVEVREEWKQYLADNQIEPQSLLKDVVHLNDKGCKLMEALVWRHLRYDAHFANPHAAWIRTVPVQLDANGACKITFSGNRVDVVAGATDKPLGTARILLDGKPPSANPKAYAVTRPGQADGVWWPAILTVGCQQAPLIEEWTLKLTDISSDAKQFKFAVTGSKTGPDGAGSSAGKFVSASGRVVIDPRDFTLASAQGYTKHPCPQGFEVKWSVVPMFQDIYAPKPATDPAKVNGTTAVKLVENGPHTIEIIPNGDGAVAIRAIRVFQPPLQ